MGYVLVVLTAKIILVNIVVVSRDPIRQATLRCKYRWAHRRQIKRRLALKLQRIRSCLLKVLCCCFRNAGEDDAATEKSKAAAEIELATIHEYSRESELETDRKI